MTDKLPTRTKVRAAISEIKIATTAEWRAEAKATRKAKRIPQHKLAAVVGVKQATVSQIESGVIGESVYVPAIAVALGIDPPDTYVANDEERRWLRLGRLVRRLGERRFDAAVQFLESIVGARDE